MSNLTARVLAWIGVASCVLIIAFVMIICFGLNSRLSVMFASSTWICWTENSSIPLFTSGKDAWLLQRFFDSMIRRPKDTLVTVTSVCQRRIIMTGLAAATSRRDSSVSTVTYSRSTKDAVLLVSNARIDISLGIECHVTRLLSERQIWTFRSINEVHREIRLQDLLQFRASRVCVDRIFEHVAG